MKKKKFAVINATKCVTNAEMRMIALCEKILNLIQSHLMQKLLDQNLASFRGVAIFMFDRQQWSVSFGRAHFLDPILAMLANSVPFHVLFIFKMEMAHFAEVAALMPLVPTGVGEGGAAVAAIKAALDGLRTRTTSFARQTKQPNVLQQTVSRHENLLAHVARGWCWKWLWIGHQLAP